MSVLFEIRWELLSDKKMQVQTHYLSLAGANITKAAETKLLTFFYCKSAHRVITTKSKNANKPHPFNFFIVFGKNVRLIYDRSLED